MFHTEDLSPMEQGRLDKALNRVYRFSCSTMSLGAFLDSKDLTRRSAYVRHYARKKRDCEYKKLANPKTEYTVWYLENGRELGMDVPKIVYDALVDLPATEREQAYS
jgi:hypothetical protein